MSIKAETVSMEITVMVYCPKCGTKNEEDVKFCVNCGAALYAEEKRERRRTTCFGAERRREDECFGLPHGGAIAGVIFGAFIILIGIALVLENSDIFFNASLLFCQPIYSSEKKYWKYSIRMCPFARFHRSFTSTSEGLIDPKRVNPMSPSLLSTVNEFMKSVSLISSSSYPNSTQRG